MTHVDIITLHFSTFVLADGELDELLMVVVVNTINLQLKIP